MDYKVKLQTNNTELANNNIDLQEILNTINNLPETGGGTVDLDAEITAQDALIAQIQTELAGKVNPPVETCTVVLPDFSVSRYAMFLLTTINNGIITTDYPDATRTIENVICGSILFFEKDMSALEPSTFLLDGEEPWWSYDTSSLFVVPHKSGETIYLRQ